MKLVALVAGYYNQGVPKKGPHRYFLPPESLSPPMHAWHQLTDQPLGKRIVTFILLATMVLWGSGITISVPNFKDDSTPFMCLDHACSCRNAGSCWSHCCCFSESEKLAWAQKHQVQPPEHFLAKVRETIDTSSDYCGKRDLKPDVYAALCTLRGSSSAKKVAASCSSGDCSSSREAPMEVPASRPISLTNAMKCHAIAGMTLIFSPVLEFDLGAGQLVALNDEAMSRDSILRPTSFSAAPDPPPPRA